MQLRILLNSLSFLLLFGMTGCACDSKEREECMNSSIIENIDGSEIINIEAYNKGIELGKELSKLSVGSIEHENYLIKIHGLISELEINGFHQSAKDMARGIKDSMN